MPIKNERTIHTWISPFFKYLSILPRTKRPVPNPLLRNSVVSVLFVFFRISKLFFKKQNAGFIDMSFVDLSPG